VFATSLIMFPSIVSPFGKLGSAIFLFSPLLGESLVFIVIVLVFLVLGGSSLGMGLVVVMNTLAHMFVQPVLMVSD